MRQGLEKSSQIKLRDLHRLNFLRIAVGLGFLTGILFSRELWFPVVRNFPRAPIFFVLPDNIVFPVEKLLTIVLVISLILIIFNLRSKIFSTVMIISLVMLVILDQMRLQPWVYQYLMLLIVLTAYNQHKEDNSQSSQTLALVQIIIAGLYFWSGLQKLNFTFTHEKISFFLAPLQDLFPSVQMPSVLIGLAAASIEALIGMGLLFRRTRKPAVCLAILMHMLILALLIVRDYNSIVWIWNAALIIIVVTTFWQSEFSVRYLLGGWKTDNRRSRTVKLIVTASVLLPILSFFGYWEMYLSGALFSGNVETPVIRIKPEMLETLPPKAAGTVFALKNSGAQMLPLFEWSMAELNVPVYPEQRVFKQITRSVCRLADDKNYVVLIVKERPAILDGSYQVKQFSCLTIEENR